MRGERSMLALSSRPWLGYSDQGKFNLVPMSYEALDYAAGTCEGVLYVERGWAVIGGGGDGHGNGGAEVQRAAF